MRSLLLLFLSACPALAREVRLLRIEAPEDAPALVHVVRGETAIELDTPRLSPSRRRLQAGPEAARYHLAVEKPTRERPLPADAPYFDLPAGQDDLLVVLYPRAGTGPIAVSGFPVAVPRDPARAGAIVWLNLSPRELLVNLGAGVVRVPVGQGRLVLPPAAPGKPFPVHIDLAPAKADEESQPMVRATWVRRDAGRQFLFILPDAERDVPRIVSVPDLDDVPPAPPPAKPDGRPAAPAPARR